MESIVLEVEKREAGGKGEARRTRASGRVPGVFYGSGVESTPVATDARSFDREVLGVEGTRLIELRSDEPALNGKLVLIRGLQEHPVTGEAVHVDFLQVPLDKPIEVAVPLHFVGKAEGVTLGGILQPIIRELLVRCLPTEIPQSIEADVSGLGIHASLHVSDLSLPAGAEPAREDDAPVVTVLPPTVAAQPEAEEGAEAVEGEAGAAPEAAAGEASDKPSEPSS